MSDLTFPNSETSIFGVFTWKIFLYGVVGDFLSPGAMCFFLVYVRVGLKVGCGRAGINPFAARFQVLYRI